jgi:hypothetical protein
MPPSDRHLDIMMYQGSMHVERAALVPVRRGGLIPRSNALYFAAKFYVHTLIQGSEKEIDHVVSAINWLKELVQHNVTSKAASSGCLESKGALENRCKA